MDYGSLHLNWNSGSFELTFLKGLTSKSHSEPKLLKLTTESIPMIKPSYFLTFLYLLQMVVILVLEHKFCIPWGIGDAVWEIINIFSGLFILKIAE